MNIILMAPNAVQQGKVLPNTRQSLSELTAYFTQPWRQDWHQIHVLSAEKANELLIIWGSIAFPRMLKGSVITLWFYCML